MWDAADIVQGKGFAGGKEGCSWWEAAEQPIETNPKAGQRSSRKQSKPVRKDVWEEVKLWSASIRTATGNRVTLWVSHSETAGESEVKQKRVRRRVASRGVDSLRPMPSNSLQLPQLSPW